MRILSDHRENLRGSSKAGHLGLAVTVLVLLSLPSIAGVAGALPLVRVQSPGNPSTSANAQSTPSPLDAAAASLREGLGPAHGENWLCSTDTGGASFGCVPSVGSAPTGSAPTARPVAPTTATLPDWTRLSFVPSGRVFAVATYDAADKQVVLFGGVNFTTSTYLSDTWVFANGGWTALNLSKNPGGLEAPAFAYDFKDKYAVLFGGQAGSTPYSATWKFVKDAWTKLTPATAPPAAVGASMVWDSNDSYLVYFGGENGTTYYGQTWTFVGGSWTKLTPATSPPARILAPMSYDASHGWVILFGGGNKTSIFNDTWNFTAGHWKRLSLTVAPPPVYGGSLTNDTLDGYLVLAGGETAHGLMATTWSFVNSSWSRLAPPTPPPAREGSASVYDSATSQVMLIGGFLFGLAGSSATSAVWTYHSGVWANSLGQFPHPRVLASMVYDVADKEVVLFGGASYARSGSPSNPVNETWTFAHGRWTHLKVSRAPPARNNAGMVYDGADGYVFLFGGYLTLSTSSATNDSWSFSAGKWTPVSTNAAPSPREGPGMAYDAADGYVVVFGGWGYTVGGVLRDLNDTWTYAGGTWTLVSPNACYLLVSGCPLSPPGRENPTMEYDAADGYVVLFGGLNGSVPRVFGDTWAFAGGTWYNLTGSVSSAPAPAFAGTMTYDSLDGYLLLYGGLNLTGAYGSTTWSFNSGQWTQLSPAHSPGSNVAEGLVFDAADREVVMEGGQASMGTVFVGTWVY